MLERIISGPPRSRLREDCARWAQASAEERDLLLTVVTPLLFYDEWQELVPGIERRSPFSFHINQTKSYRLFVVEVPDITRLRPVLMSHPDPVWILKFSTEV